MTPDYSNTVFISYRSGISTHIAHAIFLDLRRHNYDVFMNETRRDADQFNSITRNQITSRTHFLALLTPGSVQLCLKNNDYQRRQIEFAMEHSRNVVPVLLHGFRFDSCAGELPSNFRPITRAAPLIMPESFEYFEPAMQKLRANFLMRDEAVKITPAPTSEQIKVMQILARIGGKPGPSYNQLHAEKFYDQSYTHWEAGDYTRALEACNAAINLCMDYVEAYYGRGLLHLEQGNLQAALDDFTKALQYDPAFADAYFCRGNVYKKMDMLDDAITDYTSAISYNRQDARYFNNRGNARRQQQNLIGAVEDYSIAMSLEPELATAYLNLGIVRKQTGDLAGAMNDYDRAITIAPEMVETYKSRALVREELGYTYGAIADFATYLNLGGGHQYGDRAAIEEKIKRLSRLLPGLAASDVAED